MVDFFIAFGIDREVYMKAMEGEALKPNGEEWVASSSNTFQGIICSDVLLEKSGGEEDEQKRGVAGIEGDASPSALESGCLQQDGAGKEGAIMFNAATPASVQQQLLPRPPGTTTTPMASLSSLQQDGAGREGTTTAPMASFASEVLGTPAAPSGTTGNKNGPGATRRLFSEQVGKRGGELGANIRDQPLVAIIGGEMSPIPTKRGIMLRGMQRVTPDLQTLRNAPAVAWRRILEAHAPDEYNKWTSSWVQFTQFQYKKRGETFDLFIHRFDSMLRGTAHGEEHG